MPLIPPDPKLEGLERLLEPGAPEFVARAAEEMTNAAIVPGSGERVYLRYEPTVRCTALWSFPVSSGSLLVSAQLLSRDEALGVLMEESCYVAEERFRLQVFPRDGALPGLPLAVSRAWVHRALAQALGCPKDELSNLRIETIAYKPFTRCVLRYGACVSGLPFTCFAKVAGDESGAFLARALRSLEAQLREAGSPWRIAAPVGSSGYLPDTRALLLTTLAGGTEVKDLLNTAPYDSGSEAALRESMARAASGLDGFQRVQLEGIPYLSPRTMLERVAKKLPGVQAVTPALAQRAARLLAALEAIAMRLPAERVGLAHGAFRHHQLIAGEDALMVLDADGLCLAGTAADAGEFLGFLGVTALRRPHLAPAVQLCAETFTANLPASVHPAWLDWHQAAAQVKHALRSLTKLSEGWYVRSKGALELAERTLSALSPTARRPHGC
jgi:hypothetical protein